MKRILKCTAAILTVISCLLALVSCGKPKRDFDMASKNLDHNGYTVSVDYDPGTGMETVLTAKKTENGTTYSLKLMKCESIKLAKLLYQELRLQIEAQIKENKLSIKAAKHMLNKFGDELEDDKRQEYEQLIIDLNAENKELRKLLNCTGRSGKYVWQGDYDAIWATK